jgi:hypothetical protein
MEKISLKNEEVLHGLKEERSVLYQINIGRLNGFVKPCVETAF